jgi:hypothetical protein
VPGGSTDNGGWDNWENYTIYYKDIGKILSFMPKEYKKKSILSEYDNADVFYINLINDERKGFFICILNCFTRGFKEGKLFNYLLEILDNNRIIYKTE